MAEENELFQKRHSQGDALRIRTSNRISNAALLASRPALTNGQTRIAVAKPKRIRLGTSLYGLPGEIRNLIWKVLIPGGRIIRAKIKMVRRRGDDYKDRRLEEIYFPISSPVVLHVCHESRSYTMSAYRFGFDEEQNKEGEVVCNPDIDMLFLHFANDFNRYLTFKFQMACNIGLFNKVQHLALNFTKRLQSRTVESSDGMEMLSSFDSLKTVTLVFCFDQQDHTGISDPKVNALYKASDRVDVRICCSRFTTGSTIFRET